MTEIVTGAPGVNILGQHALLTIIHALITSHLGYKGVTLKSIWKLWLAQNAAAHTVLPTFALAGAALVASDSIEGAGYPL